MEENGDRKKSNTQAASEGPVERKKGGSARFQKRNQGKKKKPRRPKNSKINEKREKNQLVLRNRIGEVLGGQGERCPNNCPQGGKNNEKKKGGSGRGDIYDSG